MTALRRVVDAPDVLPQTEVRLLDWFEPIHDPGGIVSRMVLRLDQLWAKRGVFLYPQTDFRALKTVVEAHRGQGTIMMPHVDPTYSTIGAENGVWFYGVDANGRAASTLTARYYDFTGTSLAAELESFRFFYDDPVRHLTEGCFVRTPPEASQITGSALASGTLWVRPDMRGPDKNKIILSQIAGRLGRLIGIGRWWPETVFTFSSYALCERGTVANFGYPKTAFPVDWVFPTGPAPSSGMFWMTRDEMLARAADDLRQLAAA
jgi:hypothetical protein